jgi:hypothetical protein
MRGPATAVAGGGPTSPEQNSGVHGSRPPTASHVRSAPARARFDLSSPPPPGRRAGRCRIGSRRHRCAGGLGRRNPREEADHVERHPAGGSGHPAADNGHSDADDEHPDADDEHSDADYEHPRGGSQHPVAVSGRRCDLRRPARGHVVVGRAAARRLGCRARGGERSLGRRPPSRRREAPASTAVACARVLCARQQRPTPVLPSDADPQSPWSRLSRAVRRSCVGGDETGLAP